MNKYLTLCHKCSFMEICKRKDKWVCTDCIDFKG